MPAVFKPACTLLFTSSSEGFSEGRITSIGGRILKLFGWQPCNPRELRTRSYTIPTAHRPQRTTLQDVSSYEGCEVILVQYAASRQPSPNEIASTRFLARCFVSRNRPGSTRCRNLVEAVAIAKMAPVDDPWTPPSRPSPDRRTSRLYLPLGGATGCRPTSRRRRRHHH